MTASGEVPVRHRPNVFFVAAGIVVFVAGIAVAAYGVLTVANVFRTDSSWSEGSGPSEIADGAGLVAWGFIVLTAGRYLWRGARRRGWRDRLGRLLIIVGYLILAFGIDRAVHIAVGIWGADSAEEGEEIVIQFLITFAGWGLAGWAFAFPGLKLAKEKILLRAEAKAGL